MAMTVQHNAHAQLALGELNKNVSKVGKLLGKVSSGQRLNSAQDDSSSYVISEKMREQIRTLLQAKQNVQNGSSLLKSAEAGIQQQIELVRTIREKVIDADNDTNTDEDRKTIQKEMEQFYNQIDQIAYETDYNTHKPLLGERYKESFFKYLSVDETKFQAESDLHIIPDKYATLDGIRGAFDVFSRLGINASSFDAIFADSQTVSPFSGAEDIFSELSINFEDYYSTVGDLKASDLAIKVTDVTGKTSHQDYYFVLTNDPSRKFLVGSNILDSDFVVDMSGGSYEDIMSDLASKITAKTGIDASADGTILNLTATVTSDSNNNIKIAGADIAAAMVAVTPTVTVDGDNCGISGKFSGGKDAYSSPVPADPDARPSSGTAKAATFGPRKISTLSNLPSGITLKVPGQKDVNIEFKKSTTKNDHIVDTQIEVDKDSSGYLANGYVKYTVKDGSITFKAVNEGTSGNSFSIADGYKYQAPAGPPVTTVTSAANAFKGSKTGTQEGSSFAYAYLDLNPYTTDDPDTLEEFINDLRDKTIIHSLGDTLKNDAVIFNSYGFYDSKSETDALSISSGGKMDLNEVRESVLKDGKSIAEAFATLFRRFGSSDDILFVNDDDESVTAAGATKLKLRAYQPGTAGNSENLFAAKIQKAKYTLDFKDWYGKWSANNPDSFFPDDLSYKGFRVYCATCQNDWYNIIFYTDKDRIDERPQSGNSKENFATFMVNISDVKDVSGLVEAIRDQVGTEMEKKNHTLFMAADPENGLLHIYDKREYDPLSYGKSVFPNLQSHGAKIADSIIDDVIKVYQDVYVRDFVIQDTTKADMNIRLQLPDTKLNNIFGMIPDYLKKDSIRDFSLTSADDRNFLLGKDQIQGLLDDGLDYLLNAAVIIGAQNARLEYTQNNLTTMNENVQAAESTIRDADMAKEMTEYTKFNILTQSAQAILAQANQNGSQVLGLLQ